MRCDVIIRRRDAATESGAASETATEASGEKSGKPAGEVFGKTLPVRANPQAMHPAAVDFICRPLRGVSPLIAHAWVAAFNAAEQESPYGYFAEVRPCPEERSPALNLRAAS